MGTVSEPEQNSWEWQVGTDPPTAEFSLLSIVTVNANSLLSGSRDIKTRT